MTRLPNAGSDRGECTRSFAAIADTLISATEIIVVVSNNSFIPTQIFWHLYSGRYLWNSNHSGIHFTKSQLQSAQRRQWTRKKSDTGFDTQPTQ